jgi:hypothetical protein
MRKKHARGTDLLCKFFAIDDRILARYLASGDPLWPKLRELAQYLDAFYMNPKFAGTTKQVYSALEEHIRRKGDKRLIRGLDIAKKCVIIEEQ